MKKFRRALGFIRTFAGDHAKWLRRGALATLGLVLLRLALPWPLKGVIDVLWPQGGPSFGFADPILVLVGLYILIVVGVGVTEKIQRVCMARFSTHTVHDLRSAAVHGASRAGAAEKPGAFLTKVLGDAARVKESLKGILIHASQNGLYYLGVCIVCAVVSPRLSLTFVLGGLVTAWIGMRVSSRVAKVFKKQRRNEAAYATAIHESLEHDQLEELDALDRTSADRDVRVTRMITTSSLIIHAVLATTTAAAVWIGTREVMAGTLSPGDLFLFITYALSVHPRIVQVGRQLARAGKVVACVNRIGALLDDGEAPTAVVAAAPLLKELRLSGVGLDSSRAAPRLEAIDVTLQAGSKVAVLGDVGSGKTSLLRILAGARSPDRGTVTWDGAEIESLSGRVAFLPQDPVFPPRRLWMILGLAGVEAPAEAVVGSLKRLGAWKIVSGMANGLDEKVGSAKLSRSEARMLRLGALVRESASVWVLDSPFEGLSLRRARRCLEEILNRAENRTLVLSLARPVSLERFDRVIVLREGRIRFDGGPREWKERKLLKDRS